VPANFTIRFYRNQQWADRFARAGVNKPAGMAYSPYRYTLRDAAWLAQHINSLEPEHPCEIAQAL
jgi:hypothetical protein